MTIRRKTVAALAVAALALTAAGCGSPAGEPADDAEGAPTTIRLATTNPTVTLLGVYAADAQGLFEEHGLDVDITPIADATTIPAAIGKQFDVGWTVQPIGINAAASGVPIVVVGGGERNQPDNQQLFLLASPDSGISSVEDIAGKKLGSATLAGANTMLVKAELDAAGVDLDSVQFVQVPFADMPDQLAAGTVDVVAVSPPHAQIALDAGAIDLGVSPYNIIGETALTTFMMADQGWAAENEGALAEFRTALDEGGQWVQDNPEEAAELLKERTGLDSDLVDRLALQLPAFTYQDYSAEDFVPWVELMKEYGTLDPSTDADEIVAQLLGS